VEQVELKVKASMVKPVDLPIFSSSISLCPTEAKKRRGNTVDSPFNMGAREELNAIIARMFYSSGLSFNFGRNPYLCHVIHICRKQPHLKLYPSRIQLFEGHSFTK